MVISAFLIYYLIAHFLADFYFQNERTAKKKTESFKQLLIHGVIYQVLVLIPFVFFEFDLNLLSMGAIIGVSHFLIDLLKAYLFNKTKVNKTYAFLIDQALHILVIMAVVSIFENHLLHNEYASDFSNDYIEYFRWILSIILILKPANIAFKVLFGNLRPDVEEAMPEENVEGVPIKNAGAIIGNFERMLYFFCLAFFQFTTLGLIIAGKGFARHSYIQANPGFAEYFLIGTFYSALYSALTYLAIFVLI